MTISITPAALHAQSVGEIKQNIQMIQQRITQACQRVGRDPKSVRLLPVSKTKPNEILRMAYAAGVRDFGENKVQEAQQKSTDLADLEDVRWCVIGHLQTNKAKLVAKFAHEFQALDNLRVAKELQSRLEKEDRSLDVFVQVNSSDEPQKFGLAVEQVAPFLQEIAVFDRLQVKGLMTLAEFSSSEERVRGCFQRMKQLQMQLQQHLPNKVSVDALSMGMSGDFEVAIEEGATVIRVGQAIFGARNLPDSYYWPNNIPNEGN